MGLPALTAVGAWLQDKNRSSVEQFCDQFLRINNRSCGHTDSFGAFGIARLLMTMTMGNTSRRPGGNTHTRTHRAIQIPAKTTLDAPVVDGFPKHQTVPLFSTTADMLVVSLFTTAVCTHVT